MRIGFFGGTFDPPHNGHLAVARAAVERFHLDRLLLAPVASQPLKPKGPIASYEHRLAMVQLAAEGIPHLEASALDAPRGDAQPNFTIDTLTLLKSTLTPEDQLFVVVGIDAFADIRHWREPDRLLQIADWIVVSRPGMDLLPIVDSLVPASRRAHVHPLDGVHETVSATEIRHRIKAGEPCQGLLPPAVLEYITTHSLYR